MDQPTINLGKISESGMEQISMMESEDIYGSEGDEIDEQASHNQKVMQLTVSQKKEDDVENVNLRRSGTTHSKSQAKPRRADIILNNNSNVNQR